MLGKKGKTVHCTEALNKKGKRETNRQENRKKLSSLTQLYNNEYSLGYKDSINGKSREVKMLQN